jgi:hypothetical protein
MIETISSFLVGLGFEVDSTSFSNFNKAITSAAARVTALVVSIQASAAGIFAAFAHMSAGMEDLGYQLRLVAPAINKFLILRNAMISAYSAAGINLTKAVQQSILFNYSLAKTKFALEAVYKSVGIKFLPVLTKQMDIFRAKIFANMPKIQEVLTRFVNAIFKVFGATVELGERVWSILGRVWGFFAELDKATGGWSTKILLVIAAWKLLSLTFLSTPLRLVLAGLLSILALYDDFKVWQEGGESVFNWAPVVPTITAVKTVLKALLNIVILVGKYCKDFYSLDGARMIADLKGIAAAFASISNAIDKLFRSFHIPIVDKLLSLRDSVDSSVLGIFGGSGAAAAVQGPLAPQPLVGSGGSSGHTISQQNNVNITTTADPHAVASAVGGAQGQQSADLQRNLRGALR